MIAGRQILCGELHYPRIPPEYWGARMRMARAMGLDAVSTYVFWNVHEQIEGRYDFEGWNDVARFVLTAQEEGLDLVLRPGPYVCAEWDFGGLPAWLLRSGPVPIRSTDPRYFEPARRWLLRLGQELAPLQRSRGGPIVAVQMENEYGAFGDDREYLRALREVLIEAGFGDAPMFTIDQPADLARGALEGVPAAVTFAPGEAGAQFETLRALRPSSPLICGEYWAGWFDHWGEPHALLDDATQARDLDWMLRNGVSLNLYMFHGGTNFGFWNGANAFEPHPYQPTVTSYDYQAALDEAGRVTPKYFAFRNLIAGHKGTPLPAVPSAAPAIEIPRFALDRSAPLSAGFGLPVHAEEPLPMERFGCGYGYALYRAQLPGPARGPLEFGEVRDYAVVLIDGRAIGRLDRRLGETSVEVDVGARGAILEILIENCGRLNYGPQMAFELKGLTQGLRFCGRPVRGFEMRALAAQPPSAAGGSHDAPAFFHGTFALDRTGDAFLDTAALGKGVLWINGHALGRFWNIGPQRRLYVPGPWLREGENHVVALDLLAGGARVLSGCSRNDEAWSVPPQ